jgi:hypothetical protein
MNIFILDRDLVKSAQAHVDRHIVKMPLETAQLLCTARHELGEVAEHYSLSQNACQSSLQRMGKGELY